MATWDPIHRRATREEGGRSTNELAATRMATLESRRRATREKVSSTFVEPPPRRFRRRTTREEGSSTFAKPPPTMTAARGTRCRAA
ncbi:hypothetical protein GUJ93_ZPchr0005g15408 [Zizania palustris]|uniref:Uncharacterized protein n=1 Tax=Zizania palustris TaxID=103762 RepID=A0A8J5VRJ3_ZIZPA|nr:hypothetical protein GUJ93_ZPchr0005g15408 [Zizania palustris]